MSLLGGVRDVAQDLGLWWPDGDPSGCRDLGDAWLRSAAACEQAIEAIDHATRQVRLDDRGEAVDAFTEHGHRMMTELSEEAERLRQIGHALLDRADQIDQARRRVEALAAEIAASVVAGAALAIFTGGVSEALAAEAAAGLIAEAAALELTISEAAITLTTRIAAYATIGAWEAGAIDVVSQTTRAALVHQNPFSSFSLAEGWHSMALGAGTNALIGGLTYLPPLPESLPVPPPRLFSHDAFDEALSSGRSLPRLGAKEQDLFLRASWHPGRSETLEESWTYHLQRHGRGRSLLEYTLDARRFFLEHRELAVPATIGNGEEGLLIRFRAKIDGRTMRIGGYYTRDGRVVTLFDRG